MSQRIVIIGSGIGGLASAILLAKKGYDVTLVEKNDTFGGRANIFEAEGFRFDMGPSWYLMPDVFEHFFELIGEPVDRHLELIRLDPSYRIRFRDTEKTVDMHSDIERDIPLFESLEPGSGQKLKAYLEQSKYQYEVAIRHFMYKNYDSVFDFMNLRTMTEGRRLHVFEKMHQYVARYFSSDMVQKILEYQLVFLGSSPYNTPALYNIMSHIDFNMGVFYPKGGIYALIQSMLDIGKKYGVTYMSGNPVEQIVVRQKQAREIVLADGGRLPADIVISNADIHHTETELLPVGSRQFSDKYWRSRTLAPSAFIMYIGLKQKIPGLIHHNLAFGGDWKKGFAEIFDTPQWPSDPSYYVCCPSTTENDVAPDQSENLFILVPVSPELDMGAENISRYCDNVLDLLERDFDVNNIRDIISFERIYTSNDFAEDYNAFGGSALGLAHTITQTAIFRPNNVSRKVKNLYYVGAGTNPGIGMPICLISAELAYKRIINDTTDGPLERL